MTNSDEQIQLFSIELLSGITEIIEKSKTKAAVFLNSETTVLYWSIGKFINENLKTQKRTSYGNKIVATVSQQLTNKYGKGFTYPDKQWFADKLHKAIELTKHQKNN